MNINKDGKTLYFSDEEIDTESTGEKKVFVTKRINGEEIHTKAQNYEKRKPKHLKKDSNEKEKFDFDNEIVIGVTKKEEEKKNKKRTKNSEKQDSKKKENKNLKMKKDKKIKYKKLKSKTISRKLIATISIIILIIINLIFALTTPIFNITDINIEGNNKISSQTIISLSQITKGDNIFRFSNKSVISKIKENKYIESVEIKRKLPGSVRILVKEREVKYQIKLINSYAYIDKNGYILENSSIKQEIPTIVGFNITEEQLLNQLRLEEKDLEKLNKVMKIIKASEKIKINKLITEVNVKEDEDFILYIESENKKIYVGDTTNLTNKMLYIQKILENEKGKSGTIIVNGDISLGFKPYFREE